MGYFSVFDISASGLAVERTRMEVAALNLANINTTRTAEGGPFKPLAVVARPARYERFQALMGTLDPTAQVAGVEVDEVRELQVAPKLVHDPAHPDADERGFVAFPGINPVTEMVNLMQITRAYEANVRALAAAKTMALKALEIGGR